MRLWGLVVVHVRGLVRAVAASAGTEVGQSTLTLLGVGIWGRLGGWPGLDMAP